MSYKEPESYEPRIDQLFINESKIDSFEDEDIDYPDEQIRELNSRDVELFDDTIYDDTVDMLDPDRLVNLDVCPYCATKNESFAKTCKHCGVNAEWLSFYQFGEE